MCGITGLYNYNSKDISDNEFDNFVDSLKHRGPDGRGTYKDKDVFCRLGHRRLSILDLSDLGTQPLHYENGRYWITFNGEIYNFIELKNELEMLGYKFKTSTDSEVILASYLNWKEECQLKFNGMWAFAIWDSKKKELFLSRDRFGVKPLYYYIDNKRIAFASETKAFWHLEDLDINFDPQMITNILSDANIWEASDRSLIKGVKKLRAGHSAFFSKEKGLSIVQWWNTLDNLIEVPEKEGEIVDQFKDIFFDSCKIRMRSDVPVGSALSGGLDSSAIVCSINKMQNEKKFQKDRILDSKHQIFSATYPGTVQDESMFIKKIVEHTNNTANYCEVNEKKVVENIDSIISSFGAVYDLPVGPWLIYKQFRNKNCCISIDGHGADELLGGYHHYVIGLMNNSIFQHNNYFQFKKLYKTLSELYVSKNQFKQNFNYSNLLKELLKNKLSSKTSYLFLCRIYSKIKNVMNLNFNKGNIPPRDHFKWLYLDIESCEYDNEYKQHKSYMQFDELTKMLYDDFHYQTLPVILRNFDSCSMAHGVEIRSPFIDWRLVTFIFSLNQNSKINQGYTKFLLREAMKDILPESIRLRKSKIGFANPIVEWIGLGLKEYFLDHLSSQSFLNSTIWDGPKIKKHVENCYQVKNHRGVLSFWLCVISHILMETYKKKSVVY